MVSPFNNIFLNINFNIYMKKWYTSKTIWFNLITVLLGIVQVVSNTFPIPTELLGLINGIGNLILRTVTASGIDKSII